MLLHRQSIRASHYVRSYMLEGQWLPFCVRRAELSRGRPYPPLLETTQNTIVIPF